MRHLLCTLALVALLMPLNVLRAQDEKRDLLKTAGWGSLSGKVILTGDIPPVINLVPKMTIHQDKVCCLMAKMAEKVDQTWVVDKATKGVANVVVWVRPPQGYYFAMPPKFGKPKDVVIDQPFCAFRPRVSAIQPVYYDGAKDVQTGQKLTIRNSAIVNHNVRATAHPLYNDGKSFNVNVPAKTEIVKPFNPQPLPVSIQCDVHTWMSGKLFVFDHPYYAITDAKGNFTIPVVPAGAEISIMSWHEGVGYVAEGKKGIVRTLKAGKNEIDFTVKAP